MNKIVTNSIVGAFMFGLFTYFANIYEKHPNYLKISAFLWSAPLFYFFMVYITWSKSKEVMLAFTRHALLGTLLTISVFLFSILMSHIPMWYVVSLNVVILLIGVSLYFHYCVYELI